MTDLEYLKLAVNLNAMTCTALLDAIERASTHEERMLPALALRETLHDFQHVVMQPIISKMR